jgi:hypothetical protein
VLCIQARGWVLDRSHESKKSSRPSKLGSSSPCQFLKVQDTNCISTSDYQGHQPCRDSGKVSGIAVSATFVRLSQTIPLAPAVITAHHSTIHVSGPHPLHHSTHIPLFFLTVTVYNKHFAWMYSPPYGSLPPPSPNYYCDLITLCFLPFNAKRCLLLQQDDDDDHHHHLLPPLIRSNSRSLSSLRLRGTSILGYLHARACPACSSKLAPSAFQREDLEEYLTPQCVRSPTLLPWPCVGAFDRIRRLSKALSSIACA